MSFETRNVCIRDVPTMVVYSLCGKREQGKQERAEIISVQFNDKRLIPCDRNFQTTRLNVSKEAKLS